MCQVTSAPGWPNQARGPVPNSTGLRATKNGLISMPRPCRSLSSLELPRAAQVIEEGVEPGLGPSEAHPVARHEPLEIDAPGAEAAGDVQGAGRDLNLGRPSGWPARDAGVPDAVPIERRMLGIGDETIEARAGGVDAEEVTGPLVAVGIEHDRNAVVALLPGVTLHGLDGDEGSESWHSKPT
jgi:hypothetical protein